jgi:hypothetical protein
VRIVFGSSLDEVRRELRAKNKEVGVSLCEIAREGRVETKE